MRKKLVLMGRSGCGKTSMRSVIFSAYRPQDTDRLGSTVGLEHTHINFLTSLKLNLWDCGGQDTYIDGWLNRRADEIFTAVQLLVYVYDLHGDAFEQSRDANYFRDCVNVLQRLSPGTPVICLLHKMDLIRKEDHDQVFESIKAHLQSRVGDLNVRYYPTSIHDESLYKAWSRIMRTLIPDYVSLLEQQLSKLARICSAAEVVLLEYSTLLLISRSTAEEDPERSAIDHSATVLGDGQSTASSADGSDSSDGENDQHLASSGSVSETSQRSTSYAGSELQRTHQGILNPNRFEKITSMIKKLREVTRKQQSSFCGVEIRTGAFTAYLDQLTRHMIILVIVADPSIQLPAIKMNVDMSKKLFRKQENESFI